MILFIIVQSFIIFGKHLYSFIIRFIITIINRIIGDYLETKIRQFRQEKAMTQQELADLAGVTRQTINALENARYNPSLVLAYKITKILGNNAIEEVFLLSDEE